MTEKAVMIGLLVGLLGSAGVIWAKIPPRAAMQSTHLKQTPNAPTAEVATPTAELAPPKPVRVEPQLPTWTEHPPKEVMPADTPDARPRLVQLPKARPVGAKRCHCHKPLRKLLVLQTHGETHERTEP